MESKDDINPPIGWAQTAKVPPGWKDPDSRPNPPRDPESRRLVEVVLGFNAAAMGLFLALLAGHNTALRIVPLVLSLVGMGLCAHGGRRLRRRRQTPDAPMDSVPYAPRELAEIEQGAIAVVSPLERALFAGSIRYVTDLSGRSGNKIAPFVKKNGFVAGFQLFVSQQLTLVAGAVGWTGVLGIAINTSLGRANPTMVVATVVLFVTAACGIVLSFSDIAKARRLGKQFQANGSPREELPPPTVPPMPSPLISALASSVFALDVIGIGACLMTAKYSAPQATGVFFLIMGVVMLSVPLTLLLKRRRPKVT